MELVRVELSLYQALEARFKRSQMITLDMVDKIFKDANILVPIYHKHIDRYERKLGISYNLWSEKTIKEVEKKFEEKYYPKGVLKI